MKHRVLFSSLAAALPAIAFAQSSDTYQCTMGDLTRRVEIARESGAPVPCEVLYFKDSEAPGERQVLWSAANEAGYCESQAQGFVEKLQGLGWECQSTPGSPAPAAAVPPAAPTEPAEPADDTDALAAPPEPR
jgi:hypothetical protein